MAAPTERQHGSKFNKKRKKSFLQNARGMGKKGKYGHGTQLDPDTYDYFIRILELLKGDFDTPEERESLVKNALIMTEGKEIDQSCNQVGCRTIEALLKLAPHSYLLRYMDVFATNLRVVFTNRFASHVLETLLSAVTKVALDGSQSSSCGKDDTGVLTSDSAIAWVVKVSKFGLNNIEEFIWDEYANYVIRTILLSLAGLPSHNVDSQNKQRSDTTVLTSTNPKSNDEPPEEIILPGDFKEVLKSFYSRISSSPQFAEFAYSNSTSALLQTLIASLSKAKPKLAKKLIKQLIDQSFKDQNSEGEEKESKKDLEENLPVSAVFTTDASLRLLETVLEHAEPKHVTQVYAMFFMGHITDLACDQATNFSVQKLLAHMNDKVEFEFLFEEIAPGIEKVLESKMSGVIFALAQACKRLSVKQGPFIEHLMKALHCMEPAERRPQVVPLCVRLCNFEDFKAQDTSKVEEKVAKDGVAKSKFNLHGTLIVQTMLKFNKPIKIVNSLLEMPGSELKALMCDTKGCHIMDVFAKSEFVGEKSRERLLHRLLGSYVAMACSKHGSRALEALYAVSSPKNQMKIMEELASRTEVLMATLTGSIIANKYSLDLFRRSRNEWTQLQTRKERTKEMFAGIIGGSTKAAKTN